MKYMPTACLACVLSIAVAAATPTLQITGTYSSLHYAPEGGDLLGTEISIVLGGGAHYAVVQCAEGEPGIPIVAKVQVEGAKISFTVPKESDSGCPAGTFIGTVSATDLKGKFSALGESEVLKRKKSYWQ